MFPPFLCLNSMNSGGSKVAVKVGQKLPSKNLLLRILGDGSFLASRSVIESRLELKQKNYFAA